MRSQLSLDLSSPTRIPVEARIAEFKQDPDKMDQVTEFVNSVLATAQTEAEKKSSTEKSDIETDHTLERSGTSLINGLKKGRIVTRARGVVMRLFEAICNCTNSGNVPAQMPTTSKT